MSDEGELGGDETPGFFNKRHAAVWRFLFAEQRRAGVSGNLFEIGVFRCRSALFLASMLEPHERLVAVDPWRAPEVDAELLKFRPGRVVFIPDVSESPIVREALAPDFGTFQFVHVDGNHTARSVRQDLALAAECASEHGVICADDFFAIRYPQVTMAVFEFARDGGSGFELFLCGFGKAYLARKAAADRLRRAILDGLAKTLESGYPGRFTIFKTELPEELNCFSIGRRVGDYDYHGSDHAPSTITL